MLVRIQLSEEDQDLAWRYGQARQSNAIRHGMAHVNGKDPDWEADARRNVRAAAAEIAVARFAGQLWSGHQWFEGAAWDSITRGHEPPLSVPDVLPDIEVKYIGPNWPGMRVFPRGLHTDRRYVAATLPFRYDFGVIHIIGWAGGEAIAGIEPTSNSRGRPCYDFPREYLLDPRTLCDHGCSRVYHRSTTTRGDADVVQD